MTTKLTTRQRDKLIEAAQNAIEFSVSGTGDFPVDMLRYDICWPASQADSRLLEIDLGARKDQRTINLKGLKIPTSARWHSFGWEVVPS